MRDGLAGGGLKLSAPVGPGAPNRPKDVFQVESILNGSGLLARALRTGIGNDMAQSRVGLPVSDLDRSDGVDFDLKSVMQRIAWHNGPGRAVIAHDAGVDGVDFGPERHIGNVNGHLEGFVETASGRFKNGCDIGETVPRLAFNRADDRVG